MNFRIAIVVAAVWAIAGVGGYWWGKRNLPTSHQLVAMLTEQAPGLGDARVALKRCQLSIARETLSDDKSGLTRNALNVDLSLFDLKKAQVRPDRAGSAVFRASLRPVSERLVEQAGRVVQALSDREVGTLSNLKLVSGAAAGPAPQQPDGAAAQPWSHDKIRKVFDRPGGTLAFRHETMPQIAGEEPAGLPQPPAEARGFHDYAVKVMALDAPISTAVTLDYKAGMADPSKLVSGSVVVPKELSIRFASEAVARAFAEAIYRYQMSNCSSG